MAHLTRTRITSLPWQARVTAVGRPAAEASCLETTATGITFQCRMPFHPGDKLTVWLSGAGWQRPDGVRWTPVSTQVSASSYDGECWTCVSQFHDTQRSAIRALVHALAAVGRPHEADSASPVADDWLGADPSAGSLSGLLRPPPGGSPVFCHEGRISIDTLQAVSDELRHCLVLEMVPPNQAASAWAVATELLRNAQMHGTAADDYGASEEGPVQPVRPVCALSVALRDRAGPGRTPAGIWIGCASMVRTAQLPGLLPLLRGLHLLDPQTVFGHFSNILHTAAWSRRWNAPPSPRFGLLTLAREAKSAVEANAYSVSPSNRQLARLVISVQV